MNQKSVFSFIFSKNLHFLRFSRRIIYGGSTGGRGRKEESGIIRRGEQNKKEDGIKRRGDRGEGGGMIGRGDRLEVGGRIRGGDQIKKKKE